MPLRDLVVHIDHGRDCAARLDAAVALAARHEAHLTGVFVRNEVRLPQYLLAEVADDLLARQAELAAAAVRAAEATFTERTKREAITSEWRCVDGATVPSLGLHGRYADVIVAGQHDASGEAGTDEPGMPERLILSAGRPVLVVPYAGTFPMIGERVMVAWDASRLASRAVHDALPILQKARKVVVLAVNPEGGDGHGDVPCADICTHLARHGVKAEAQSVYADDLSAGEMLLSRAAEEGIDLLVTGAYGHARWREIVLGGVTRHLLAHMTVPVLMSH
jgi:nucleotide-binding universal stress UspA family protein